MSVWLSDHLIVDIEVQMHSNFLRLKSTSSDCRYLHSDFLSNLLRNVFISYLEQFSPQSSYLTRVIINVNESTKVTYQIEKRQKGNIPEHFLFPYHHWWATAPCQNPKLLTFDGDLLGLKTKQKHDKILFTNNMKLNIVKYFYLFIAKKV